MLTLQKKCFFLPKENDTDCDGEKSDISKKVIIFVQSFVNKLKFLPDSLRKMVILVNL